ncbi:hypothetical protein ACR6HW_14300 [Fusibacter sp. JL298sf-3]
MKYLQVQTDGTITDCISFPYGDYVPFEGDVPQDVMGGWYKLIDGAIIEFPELKPVNRKDEIEKLKAEQALVKKALDEILFNQGGAL